MRAWQEIKTWAHANGWYINPSTGLKYCYVGDDVRLGASVRLGNSVRLGDFVRLGDDVQLGDFVRLGASVRLGNSVRLGASVRLGDGVRLGDDVQLGASVRLGDGVRLGYSVRLGHDVRLGDDVQVPVYQSWSFAIHWHSPGTIRAGCLIKPFDWWFEHRRYLAERHRIPPDEQERYAGYVEQIIAWEKLMGDKIGWVKEADK